MVYRNYDSRMSPAKAAIAALTGILTLGLASPSSAVDGALEISQACAINTGCFTGDTPGFPVVLTAAGSYVLTSNLTVSTPSEGIFVAADNVSVDLNGFTITGSGVGTGVFSPSAAGNTTVLNGTVANFDDGLGLNGSKARVEDVRAVDNTGFGIVASSGSSVTGCIVDNSGGAGIFVGNDSRVIGNTANNNGDVGLQINGGGYSDNVFINNNSGNANPQVSGTGVEIGINLCGTNTTCP
jgi:hypothetical protein